MNITLDIDSDSCIKCGKCAKVCPSNIFVQSKAGSVVELVDVKSCIACGHCVAVCPTDSVLHSEFPEDKMHSIDYNQLPTSEQMMLLCKARRSNRTITSKPIPAEMLDQIIEAAHCAPTATNAQTVSFTLVTDPQKLRQISDFTIATFDGLLKIVENPLLKLILKPLLPGIYKYVPVFERLKQDHASGQDPILRKATALLLIHTPKSNRFGCEDSNLAYQNASLMAECLGVSQVYMGFVITAIKQKKSVFARLMGIEGNVHAIMALGMPAYRYPKYMDRKEAEVQKMSSK